MKPPITWANGYIVVLAGTNVLVANNTFIGWGGGGGRINVSGPGLHVYNNLLYKDPVALLYWINDIYNSGISTASMVSNNNLYYGLGSNSFAYYNPFTQSEPIFDTLATWQTGTTWDTNSITSDPLFVNGNYSNGDYHLTASSPAIAHGINLTSYCSSAPALCIDYDGNPRPSTGPWTIGAYEYTGGGTVTPPTTPPSTYTIGDFNHDGLVNSLDLSMLTGAWNTNNSTYDLNHDGIVNSLDYVIMVQNWTP